MDFIKKKTVSDEKMKKRADSVRKKKDVFSKKAKMEEGTGSKRRRDRRILFLYFSDERIIKKGSEKTGRAFAAGKEVCGKERRTRNAI